MSRSGSSSRRRSAIAASAAAALFAGAAQSATLTAFVDVAAGGSGAPVGSGFGAYQFSTSERGLVGEGVREIRAEGTSADGPIVAPPCCIQAKASGFGDESRRFGGSAEIRVVDLLPADRDAFAMGRWEGIFSRDAATTSIDFTVTELTYGASGGGFFDVGAIMSVFVNPIGPAPETLRLDTQVAHTITLSATPSVSDVLPTINDPDVTGDIVTEGPPGVFTSAEVTIDPFTRAVDISDVPVGAEFFLTVDWTAFARSTTANGFAFVDFVDPLDLGGGFTFDDRGLTPSPLREDFDAVALVPAPASAWFMAWTLALAALARRRDRTGGRRRGRGGDERAGKDERRRTGGGASRSQSAAADPLSGRPWP